MMRIKRARQILKSFADDTRLRIINLLNKKNLNVTELCEILEKKQSGISKHLARLRLTGVVTDKRKGLNVYYGLAKSGNKAQSELMIAIITGLRNVEMFQDDLERLARCRPESSKRSI